jgi:hypothetical protein
MSIISNNRIWKWNKFHKELLIKKPYSLAVAWGFWVAVIVALSSIIKGIVGLF